METLFINAQEIWEKYRLEVVILTCAFFIAAASIIVYFQNSIPGEEIIAVENSNESTPSRNSEFIYIDIAGAVKKPDMYKLNINDRLKDALNKAGGLAEDADQNFFARNFNLARLLVDQEKIYIPYLWETTTGIFIEQPKTLDFTSAQIQQGPSTVSSGKISLNSADIKELDTLPGVGKVTAEKIIQNRPYTNLTELVDKKIISQSVYQNIQNLIDL